MSEFEDKLNSVLGDPAQMEKIANLALNHPYGFVGSQGQAAGIFRPIPPCKKGVFPILLQNLLHQRIQNCLLALKMAVKGCLPNADSAGNLRKGGCFKPLYRE